jgi:hypothetical protein
MDESFRQILQYFVVERSAAYLQKGLLIFLSMILVIVLIQVIGSYFLRRRNRIRMIEASDEMNLSVAERDLVLEAARGRERIDPKLMLGSIGEFHRLFGPLMHELIAKAPTDREAKNRLDTIFILRKKLFGDISYHFGSITSTIQLKIGQKVTLQYSHEGQSLSSPSMVVDVDGAAITVTSPRDGGHFQQFVQGHPFRLSFFRENDGYYQFDTHALRKTEPARQQFLLLAHALRIERIQSREFFRETTRITFKFRRFAWDNRPETRYLQAEEGEEKTGEGLILNLGGGGIFFLTSEPLTRNDVLTFDLPLIHEVMLPELMGKVVRVDRQPEEEVIPGEERGYTVNLQFLNIKTGEQDLIVRLIQQHKFRKEA